MSILTLFSSCICFPSVWIPGCNFDGPIDVLIENRRGGVKGKRDAGKPGRYGKKA
jgi:hypothetical protein